ncbi:hypothetical protein FY526_26700, partial [Clostridioides difficile]
PDHGTVSFIADKILRGNIVIDLSKPVRLPVIVFFNEIGSLAFNFCFVVIPSIIFSMVFIKIPLNIISASQLLLFFISFVLAYILSFLMCYLIASLSIWIGNVWGVLEMYDALIMIFGGSLVPLSLYPGLLKTIAVYTP